MFFDGAAPWRYSPVAYDHFLLVLLYHRHTDGMSHIWIQWLNQLWVHEQCSWTLSYDVLIWHFFLFHLRLFHSLVIHMLLVSDLVVRPLLCIDLSSAALKQLPEGCKNLAKYCSIFRNVCRACLFLIHFPWRATVIICKAWTSWVKGGSNWMWWYLGMHARLLNRSSYFFSVWLSNFHFIYSFYHA